MLNRSVASTPATGANTVPLASTGKQHSADHAMNNLFNPPKFNADGSLNPRHRLSKFAIVFIDDILIFSKSAK